MVKPTALKSKRISLPPVPSLESYRAIRQTAIASIDHPGNAKISSDERQNAVLQFDGRLNDETVLAHVAPWVHENNEVDILGRWRGNLFMSRLIEHFDGHIDISNIRWGRCGSDSIKGTVATPAGKIIVELSSYPSFRGCLDALLWTGLAKMEWVRTGRHGSSPNAHMVDLLGCQRRIRLMRVGAKYDLRIGLTTEEGEEVDNSRAHGLTQAKAKVIQEVGQLPKSQTQYLERFSKINCLCADMIGARSCESEGGYFLDDGSRGAILTQLDKLRRVILQASANFDRNARKDAIADIARRHERAG